MFLKLGHLKHKFKAKRATIKLKIGILRAK